MQKILFWLIIELYDSFLMKEDSKSYQQTIRLQNYFKETVLKRELLYHDLLCFTVILQFIFLKTYNGSYSKFRHIQLNSKFRYKCTNRFCWIETTTFWIFPPLTQKFINIFYWWNQIDCEFLQLWIFISCILLLRYIISQQIKSNRRTAVIITLFRTFLAEMMHKIS